MGLESAQYIGQLVAANPAGGDLTSQGDDHMRMIKDVLKKTFPGAAGAGYASAILATEAELNHLQGLTVDIVDAIFPSGTSMVFYQASAPTGWTKSTSHNDAMLRVVSGNGGGSGGSDSAITHMHTTAGHTLTTNEIPAHNHNSGDEVYFASAGGTAQITGGTGMAAGRLDTVGLGHAHSHGNTGVYSPKYIDMIIAVRD